jgi:hypothetical protein
LCFIAARMRAVFRFLFGFFLRATMSPPVPCARPAYVLPPGEIVHRCEKRRGLLPSARRLVFAPACTVGTTTDALWYFGYGSNMCRATFLHRRGMRPLETLCGWLANYRLCFNIPVGPGERGVANLEPAQGMRTYGVLYLLAPDEFDRLDRTEGVHIGVYRRISVPLITGGGEFLAGFTYQSSRTIEGRKPSPRYMRLLLDGAAEQDLPRAYVDFLEGFELAVDEREAPQGG